MHAVFVLGEGGEGRIVDLDATVDLTILDETLAPSTAHAAHLGLEEEEEEEVHAQEAPSRPSMVEEFPAGNAP